MQKFEQTYSAVEIFQRPPRRRVLAVGSLAILAFVSSCSADTPKRASNTTSGAISSSTESLAPEDYNPDVRCVEKQDIQVLRETPHNHGKTYDYIYSVENPRPGHAVLFIQDEQHMDRDRYKVDFIDSSLQVSNLALTPPVALKAFFADFGAVQPTSEMVAAATNLLQDDKSLLTTQLHNCAPLLEGLQTS